MNGFIIDVLRSKYDCSNGGITSRHDTLTLIGEGVSGPFAPAPDRPAVTYVKRTIGWQEYIHLVPCDDNAQPSPGLYMAGGSFGYSSDSRFREINQYPISIHDRTEPNTKEDAR